MFKVRYHRVPSARGSTVQVAESFEGSEGGTIQMFLCQEILEDLEARPRTISRYRRVSRC
jgi:hypothetical protein